MFGRRWRTSAFRELASLRCRASDDNRGNTEFYRGAAFSVDFLPKAKVELAVDDSIAKQVMEAVCNVARTGKTGDGEVWILKLEQALRVRTAETGADAI